MKFFEFSEIIYAVILSALYAIFSGGLYSSAKSLFFWGGKLLLLPFDSFFQNKPSALRKKQNAGAKAGIKEHIYDLFFFLFIGFLYLILIFFAMDGIFRIYIFAIFIFCFLFSNKTLGTLFEKIINFVSVHLYRLLYATFSLVLFPLRILVFKIFAIIKIPLAMLCRYIEAKKEYRLIKRKKSEILTFCKTL